MRNVCSLLVLLLLCAFVHLPPALASCTIDDEEEHAVLAAALFPNEPDVPDRIKSDLERKAYLAMETVRLNGFHGSYYRVLDETSLEKPAKEPDGFMNKDFYERNGQACKIDRARLLAHVPEGRVGFVTAEETDREFREWLNGPRKRPGFGGITYLSRPGFNEDHTEAVVEVHHQASPRMGVGHRVYLRKSPKTGKWFITGAVMTRIS
jgi:hypothetical protein